MANIDNIDIYNEKEKYSEDEIDRRMKVMFPRRSKLSYREKRRIKKIRFPQSRKSTNKKKYK